MCIIGNDLTLFFISVLGHHLDSLDSLECKMYTKNQQELAGSGLSR